MTEFSLRLPHTAGRFNWDASVALKVFLLITIGTVVLVPLTLLLINSFQIARPHEAVRLSLDGWRKALGEEGILQALINTVTLTFGRQAISLPIAIVFAWLIARTDMPARPGFESSHGPPIA